IGEEKAVSHEPITLDPSTFNLQANVMVPPNSLIADKEMILNRFPQVKVALEKLALDRISGNIGSKLAILSGGGVFETLKQVLEASTLLEEFALYAAASSYPVAESQLLPFLANKETLVVVEEKRGFLEGEVRALINKHKLSIEVFGKEFGDVEGFPAFGGLSYEMIYQKLNLLLDVLQHKREEVNCALPTKLDVAVP